MSHIARVTVESRDCTRRVDVLGEGALVQVAYSNTAGAAASARAWNVEGRQAPVGTAQEAVIHIARVSVVSRDHARQVEAEGNGALEGACARARSIEGREGAVASAQEAVVHIARVLVDSRDHPRRVDAEAEGALASGCARAWGIERGDGGLLLLSGQPN